MMPARRRIALLLCALPLFACGATGQQLGGGRASTSGELTIFAAASLTEGFTELGRQFEQANPGVTVRLSFAGSGALVHQLEEGAPADVLATADVPTMDRAVEADVVADPVLFAANRLEIAVPPDNPADIENLADLAEPENTIALCAAEVPCGAATAAVFDIAELTSAPDTEEQDVKAVLTKVVLGEADAGLVYRTDVRSAGEAVLGIDFPEAEEVVNDYPIAPVVDAPQAALAASFVEFVRSAEGTEVLTELGFEAP